MAIPLFILAGTDPNDSFASERIFKLKFQGKFFLEYLVDEAKKSDCFSEINLISHRKVKEKFSSTCFFTPLETILHRSQHAPREFLTGFIEAKNSLWKNIKIIHDFAQKKYRDDNTQVAILTSDILPSSADFQEVFSKCQPFFDRDVILLGTPSEKLRKKRGKHFLKKDENSAAQAYSGTGGLYIIRPLHLDEKLVYFLASLRMPRSFRKIEVEKNKIHIEAIKSIRGLIFFSWQIIKIIISFLFFGKKIFLGSKTFLMHQRRTLTFKELEINLTKVFIKRKYRRQNNSSFHLQILDNPVFVEDIDNERDFEILTPLDKIRKI